MTEQELRAIVRDAVARRLGVQGPGSSVHGPASRVRSVGDRGPWTEDLGPSHAIYLNIVNVSGECVIEPSVPCNHCNYCKSHGH